MTDINDAVDGHYGFSGILSQIMDGLNKAGKDILNLSIEDLAPIDEFHTRGRDSTLELTTLAEMKPSDDVLDIGCGLGGSARHIAHEYKSR